MDSKFHGHWKTVTSSSISPNLSKHWRFLAFWLSLCFGIFLLFLVCHDTAFLVEHTCNDHPWLTSETCQCLLAGRKLFSCWICNKSRKNHLTKSQSDIFNLQKVILFIFIQLIWQILKQLSHSGSGNSARYIPWRFASPCIFTPIHLP